MLIKTNIYKEIEIKKLEDLPKLKILMEENNLQAGDSIYPGQELKIPVIK